MARDGSNPTGNQGPFLQDCGLPDPLVATDGTPIRSLRDWQQTRRPELLRLFAAHVYGRLPGGAPPMRVELLSEPTPMLDGKALRKELRVRFGPDAGGPKMDILTIVPRHSALPVPGFLALNFRGNHTIDPDPGIALNDAWVPEDGDGTSLNHLATDASRGSQRSRWPLERIVGRGFGVATIYCGDIDPDVDDGFRNGVHPVLDPALERRSEDAWGTIGAWAWGLSRALDVLQQDEHLDASRLAVLGHSRLGKTALWAGATDERFAAVFSNNSGCGGASLSRRKVGETVARITETFPHWFCSRFSTYADDECRLPVDQHELLALIAPRPLYVASATEDQWADPEGEFLACLHADPVYRLLGTEGLPVRESPPPDTPAHGRIGYHLRTGNHDVTPYDWDQFMDFMTRHGLGPRLP